MTLIENLGRANFPGVQDHVQALKLGCDPGRGRANSPYGHDRSFDEQITVRIVVCNGPQWWSRASEGHATWPPDLGLHAIAVEAADYADARRTRDDREFPPVTETTVFRELDDLLRAGILTEDEHAAAEHKLRARGAPHFVRARHAAASAAGQPRHAKPPRRRWPAVAAALVLFAAAVTTVALLARPKHHHPAAQPPASQSLAQSSPIILGSPVNSAVAINLDGANARITVASLIPAPRAATSKATTYSASVTVAGVSGSFALDPASFSAHSATGQSFPVTPTALNPLTARTVGAGQQVQASIGFMVPSGQHITAILFTTRLGEQLGLWSTP